MDEQNLSKLLKTAQNKWLKQNSKISSRRVNEWILPARKKIRQVKTFFPWWFIFWVWSKTVGKNGFNFLLQDDFSQAERLHCFVLKAFHCTLNTTYICCVSAGDVTLLSCLSLEEECVAIGANRFSWFFFFLSQMGKIKKKIEMIEKCISFKTCFPPVLKLQTFEKK